MNPRPLRSNVVARRLIRCAARRVPVMLAARLEEEWLAHLQALASPWSGTRLAVGCCWASAVIARTHRQDAVQGPAPLALHTGGITLDDRDLKYLSLRPVTFFLIVELQATLLCGLVLPL